MRMSKDTKWVCGAYLTGVIVASVVWNLPNPWGDDPRPGEEFRAKEFFDVPGVAMEETHTETYSDGSVYRTLTQYLRLPDDAVRKADPGRGKEGPAGTDRRAIFGPLLPGRDSQYTPISGEMDSSCL